MIRDYARCRLLSGRFSVHHHQASCCVNAQTLRRMKWQRSWPNNDLRRTPSLVKEDSWKQSINRFLQQLLFFNASSSWNVKIGNFSVSRLRPMDPVNVDGPPINRCLGIRPGSTSFLQSSNCLLFSTYPSKKTAIIKQSILASQM